MGTASIDQLIDFLRQAEMVKPARLEEFLRENQSARRGVETLLPELVRRKWLTEYQAARIGKGRIAELHIGPYLILDLLGEGGMGRVYKARHQQMQRLVALKVLRKQVLGDVEAVQRFEREIRAASQLDHPNVVHALDASPFGGGYFLAMEYLEGIDLARLVRDSGVLPAAKACEYVRQAALGLQHIHERGLVHRDIKPPNLLVTQAHGSQSVGLVKVLDLGLARLHYKTNGGKTSLVTVMGNSVMMGTPDYLAPEQALDFHQADIRSDIYSLGCTLYFLLAGQPPFPGGSLTHKLLRHQQAAPPAIERLCPKVPPALPPIVGRMLAKEPKDRYQVPAEAAAALAQVLAVCGERRRSSKRATPRSSSDSTQCRPAPALTGDATEQLSGGGPAPELPHRRRSTKRFLPLWSLAAAVLLSLGSIAWIFVGSNPSTPHAEESNAAVAASTADTIHPSPSYEAYIVPSGTLGAQTWTGDLGLAFDVNSNVPVEVTQLGAFDNGSQSYLRFGPLSVRLYDRNSSGSPLASVTFSTANPGTQVNGSTFMPLVSPLILPPGFQGMIVASGYNKNNKNGNTTQQTQTWTTNTGGGLISFTGRGFYNTIPGSYPKTGSGGPANRYAAGTFMFRAAAAVPKVANPTPTPKSSPPAKPTTPLNSEVVDLSSLSVVRHEGGLSTLAVSADGQRVASVGHDGSVRIWRLADEKLQDPVRLPGHEKAIVRAVVFSPDGKLLATAGEDKTVRCWDLAASKERNLFKMASSMRAVAFSPDGKTLAFGGDDSAVTYLDVPGGSQRKGFSLQPPGGGYNGAFALGYAPDGRTLAVGLSNQLVHLHDAASGQLRSALSGHTDTVRAVAFSPDGKLLASQSKKETILWSAPTGKELFRWGGPYRTGLAFSSDGAILATGGHQLWIFDTASGQKRLTAKTPMSVVEAVGFVPGGRLLVFGGWQGLTTWNVPR